MKYRANLKNARTILTSSRPGWDFRDQQGTENPVMPFPRPELVSDKGQIDLLFKLMTEGVFAYGETDEMKMIRHLVRQNFARIHERDGVPYAIATLEGAELFRHYYNGLNREDAVAKHQLAQQGIG
jgi:hypothetical protein